MRKSASMRSALWMAYSSFSFITSLLEYLHGQSHGRKRTHQLGAPLPQNHTFGIRSKLLCLCGCPSKHAPG
jgi:hypothetical protein